MPPLKRKPLTIGIVGSRRRDTRADYQACLEQFAKIYKKGDRIVSGGCLKGGDRFAEILARAAGCTIIIHHADWDGEGRVAGFIRNSDIANDCDVLIAVVAKDRTGGTEDTVKKALKLKKRVVYA